MVHARPVLTSIITYGVDIASMIIQYKSIMYSLYYVRYNQFK